MGKVHQVQCLADWALWWWPRGRRHWVQRLSARPGEGFLPEPWGRTVEQIQPDQAQ